jgi:phosphoribosylanthranilate isomerase
MLGPPEFPFVVKVCGITNEADARVAVEAGANALGFNFYENSLRFVTPQRATEIIAAVPGDYLRVGIYVHPARGHAIHPALDVVQLYGDWQPELAGRVIWKATTPGDTQALSQADAYVMDTPTPSFGGSGNKFDWALARGRSRIILAGGLDGANVADAIATALPWGVDACSRLESSPGMKDARKVREFVNAARQAFHIHSQQELSI